MSRKYFLVLDGIIDYVPGLNHIVCSEPHSSCLIIRLDQDTKVTTRGSKKKHLLGAGTFYRGNQLLANGKDRYWIRWRE